MADRPPSKAGTIVPTGTGHSDNTVSPETVMYGNQFSDATGNFVVTGQPIELEDCANNHTLQIRRLTHELATLVEQRDNLQLEIAAQMDEKSGALDTQKSYYENLLRVTEEHAARELQQQEADLKQLHSKIGSIRNANLELNRQVGEYAENWDECVCEKESAILVRDRALRQVKDLEEKLLRAEKDFEGIDREMQEQADRVEKANENADRLSAAARIEKEVSQRMENDVNVMQEQLRAKEAAITHMSEQILSLQNELRIALSTATPVVSPFNTISQASEVPFEPNTKRRLRIKRRPAVTAFSELGVVATSPAGNCEERDAGTGKITRPRLSLGEDMTPANFVIRERSGRQYKRRAASISSICSLNTTTLSTSGQRAHANSGDFSEDSRLLSSVLSWPGSPGASSIAAHVFAPYQELWDSHLSPAVHDKTHMAQLTASGLEPRSTKQAGSKSTTSRIWVVQYLIKVILMAVMILATVVETRQYKIWKSANGVSRAIYVAAEADEWYVRIPSADVGWSVVSPSGQPVRPSKWPPNPRLGEAGG